MLSVTSSRLTAAAGLPVLCGVREVDADVPVSLLTLRGALVALPAVNDAGGGFVIRLVFIMLR